MIELPEAIVLARQVAQTLSGRKIVHAAAGSSPHKFAWYTGDPGTYGARLAGRTIRGASASGWHVEIQADDLLLVISTPMKYHAPGEKRPAKHQLLLEFDDASALSCTVQMWGGLELLPQDGTGAQVDYFISRGKPSPLSDAFDRAYFDRLLDASGVNLSTKEFLATKQRIPGLGNGVLQDVLWAARLHPRRKISSLSASEMNAMFGAGKGVPAEMAAKGGRDTERDLFDCPGSYKTVLSKNTVGSACPACGAAIRKEAYLGGAVYFCPGCQTLN